MQKFIYLLHETAITPNMSPAEIQAMIQRYKNWSTSMAEKGHLLGGHKLEDGTGRVLKGQSVTDGPYAESKDVIGGLFIVEANDYQQAAELARTCPHLDYGT